MKIETIREIAKRQNLKSGRMKKAELIRLIQHAEGNQACFGTDSLANCGQVNCLWREDCN